MTKNDGELSLRIDARIKLLTEFREYAHRWYQGKYEPEGQAELRKRINKTLIPARMAVVEAGAMKLMTIGPSKAKIFVHTDNRVAERARALHAAGIKPLDALHLASAMEVQADYFCTCDDRLLRRARAVDTLPTRVVSPLELIAEVTR